jgi:hypothetical protein
MISNNVLQFTARQPTNESEIKESEVNSVLADIDEAFELMLEELDHMGYGESLSDEHNTIRLGYILELVRSVFVTSLDMQYDWSDHLDFIIHVINEQKLADSNLLENDED